MSFSAKRETLHTLGGKSCGIFQCEDGEYVRTILPWIFGECLHVAYREFLRWGGGGVRFSIWHIGVCHDGPENHDMHEGKLIENWNEHQH